MMGFKTALGLMRLLPPEFAHRLALLALQLRAIPGSPFIQDPFEWQGLQFRNRVGIAAGFDKNAVALRGIEALGAGFVEVGTILVKPWRGNQARPRVKRFKSAEAVWNRLGFPSLGLDKVRRNLETFPRDMRKGLVVGCNIGPHPAKVRAASSVSEYVTTARDELLQLASALFEHADFFVVNLSSPNTPGLRKLLQWGDLSEHLFEPLRQAIRQLEAKTSPPRRVPLLVKLPPEDADRVLWSTDSLKAIIDPLLATDACDGFVAVNTSSRLAAEFGEDSGGISGGPLRETALQVVRMLRSMIGTHGLIIGSGGITRAEHASALLDAGASLVESYTGLIYRGPGLIPDCAAAFRNQLGRAQGAML
jgi:dihydroorotate dehydrogenase